MAAPPAPTQTRVWSGAAGWIRDKDPDLTAVKRSVRAALVMPSVFAFAHLVFSNPQVSLFGAFGSFALLLLVDFPGRPRTRLLSFGVLFLVGIFLISLGTIVSTDKVAAVVAMAVVGFAVLFLGIVTPQVATASTAALLTFVLPVAVAQPAAAVGPRLVGWALAALASIPACMLIWPTPWHDNLRRRLSAALSAVGRLAQAHAEGRLDPEALAAVASDMARLRDQFRGTPYPPTGSVPGAVALAKLVGRAEWVAGNAALCKGDMAPESMSRAQPVLGAVAETLHLSASLICDGNAHPVDDPALVRAVQESTRRLDRLIGTEFEADVSMLIDVGSDHGDPPAEDGPETTESGRRGSLAAALDPSFHARVLGISTELVADAALESAGARVVSDGRLGMISVSTSHLFGHRLLSHLSFRSVWFRNALRGAAGLALAIAVVEVTNVEHGFWVVLGTLSVLRSNALGTGATALRAVGGTAVGFVVGSLIMIGVAGHTVLLWVFLPPAVLVSGVAPSMISFAAGQAGFSVVVIILFNIIDPTGWKVGLTRVEDVAIGCAVSVVVGLLFWPRGATAALGRALSNAFVASSGYLADAVERLTATNRQVDTAPGEQASHTAYVLLDDAFRQFLAESGAKVVPVDTVAGLFTGSNRIRLAAFTLATLPAPTLEGGRSELESVAIAGAVLRDSYASSHRWCEEFAEMLADRREALDPPAVHDEILHDVLRTAFDDARAQGRADQLRTTMQMLWADEILEDQRHVQDDWAASADLFARRRHKGLMI
ncbi:MAG: FUSC family protein [Acidimicrobiales bacterium]